MVITAKTIVTKLLRFLGLELAIVGSGLALAEDSEVNTQNTVKSQDTYLGVLVGLVFTVVLGCMGSVLLYWSVFCKVWPTLLLLLEVF